MNWVSRDCKQFFLKWNENCVPNRMQSRDCGCSHPFLNQPFSLEEIAIMHRRTLAAAALASLVLVGLARAAEAQFQAGSLVVSQLGDGTTALTTGTVAVPITLVEFATSGTPTGYSVALPTTDAGPNFAITGGMTSTSFGFLTRSVDGRFLTMAGSNIDAGTTGSVFSSGSFPNRTIARVDFNGAVDTTTRFNAAGTTPRSAITTNGTDIWWSGDTGSGTTGAVRFTTLGSTTSGTLLVDNVTAPYNTRVLGIFNDQLYASSSVGIPAGSYRGVYTLGTGLEKTGPLAGTIVVGGSAGNTGNADSSYQFFFADPSTLYVADDASGSNAATSRGIQKWVKDDVTSSWSKVWNDTPADTTGMRAITGVVDPVAGTVALYGITATASGSANQLVSMFDTLSSTASPGFTTLATSPANYIFRGVALAPVPEPSTLAGAAAGLLLVGARLLRRTRRG
jgi:hypothetical protein